MEIQVVKGDLLSQPAEAIVNPWNQNFFPWWLLLPKGVSGAIKQQAGTQPFKELHKQGLLPLGQVVATSAGRLPYKYIIHAATINFFFRSSTAIVQQAVGSVIQLAETLSVRTVAFPLLGSGSGKLSQEAALNTMLATLNTLNSDINVIIVRYV